LAGSTNQKYTVHENVVITYRVYERTLMREQIFQTIVDANHLHDLHQFHQSQSVGGLESYTNRVQYNPTQRTYQNNIQHVVHAINANFSNSISFPSIVQLFILNQFASPSPIVSRSSFFEKKSNEFR
jgi:YesN/AraC family two-component response regulator